MSILLDASTRVLVHGASGRVGSYQLHRMIAYGTNVVAAVATREPADPVVPTFASITAAQSAIRADLMVSYAHPGAVRAATTEAARCGIGLVVAVAEDVPFRDVVAARSAAAAAGSWLIGPNTNGILTPGQARVGFFTDEFGSPGPVGIVSRSGTLSYGCLLELDRVGLGQSTVVGIGGGLARGTSASQVVQWFGEDTDTRVVVLLGEPGSREEEDVAELVDSGFTKPVVALVVGAVGGGDRALGHAGAIAYGGGTSYDDKVRVLQEAGVRVAAHLGEVAEAVSDALSLAAAAKE